MAFSFAEGWKMATCNDCAYYVTDEDENGNVTDFHSAKGKESGFCAIRDLFIIAIKIMRLAGIL